MANGEGYLGGGKWVKGVVRWTMRVVLAIVYVGNQVGNWGFLCLRWWLSGLMH